MGLEVKNIEHPHNLAILSSFFLASNAILVLLARHSSGELRCSGTVLIVCVEVLWPCQQQRSCRAGQLPINTVPGQA